MNKIIKTGLLALALSPILAACGGGSKIDLADYASRAAAVVGVAYNEYAQSGGISLAGGNLTTIYEIEGYNFAFTYSIAPLANPYSIEYVKISDNKLVVEIPTFAELNPQGGESVDYAAYKLSAKITYAGVKEGEKEVAKSSIGKEFSSKSWNIRVNAEKVKPVWEKISEARKKADGATVVTTGYVAAFMNNKDSAEYSNGVWLADGNDGIMLYGSALSAYFGSLHIGDMIMVIGTASPYNGLFEVKPTKISFVDSTPTEIKTPNFKETSESELAKFTTENCSDLVTLKDVTITTDVSGLTAAASTAISLGIKVGSTSYTYYVNKHTSLADREELIKLLKANAGKKCTIKAVMGYSSSKFQITACEIEEGKGLVSNFTF